MCGIKFHFQAADPPGASTSEIYLHCKLLEFLSSVCNVSMFDNN